MGTSSTNTKQDQNISGRIRLRQRLQKWRHHAGLLAPPPANVEGMGNGGHAHKADSATIFRSFQFVHG